MSFNAPIKIVIATDGNELELQGLNPRSKLYNYRYVKSSTKLNMILPLNEEQLKKLLQNNENFKK